MKRPLSIYLLTCFYGIWAVLLLLLLLGGIFNSSFGIPIDIKGLWNVFKKHLSFQLLWIAFFLIALLSCWGFWKARKYAYVLSIFFCLSFIFISFLKILSSFTKLNLSALRGLTRVEIYIAILILLITSSILYLTIRPEVGRYLGIYPQKSLSGSFE